jgi:hypothetical protein
LPNAQEGGGVDELLFDEPLPDWFDELAVLPIGFMAGALAPAELVFPIGFMGSVLAPPDVELWVQPKPAQPLLDWDEGQTEPAARVNPDSAVQAPEELLVGTKTGPVVWGLDPRLELETQ